MTRSIELSPCVTSRPLRLTKPLSAALDTLSAGRNRNRRLLRGAVPLCKPWFARRWECEMHRIAGRSGPPHDLELRVEPEEEAHHALSHQRGVADFCRAPSAATRAGHLPGR